MNLVELTWVTKWRECVVYFHRLFRGHFTIVLAMSLAAWISSNILPVVSIANINVALLLTLIIF